MTPLLSKLFHRSQDQDESVDILLIGAGIMSATLGVMLRELAPETSIEVIERMDQVAAESSSAWNNAGTGHAANCELNYTPEKADGSIDVKKAIEVNEAFEISKQFWASQLKKGHLKNPRDFINNVPHMSFVLGEEDTEYLRRRFAALQKQPLFQGMQFSEDPEVIRNWVPLVMEGRDPLQKVAATRMETGTDVNFGALTKGLFAYLMSTPQTQMHLKQEVEDVHREKDSRWAVSVKDLATHQKKTIHAKFVFIGAGGGSLALLQKSDIPEAKGYGGVPVGGEWLVTKNQDLVSKHQAKVYGKPSLGAPPMSVPHLDTRVIDGQRALLFGPFATFSTKFLKNGSWLDFANSFNLGNIKPLTEAGIHNIPLTKYLVGQLLLTEKEHIKALREYFPDAKSKDWTLEHAGQRVQVIKDLPDQGGTIQFGTEVVTSKDGTIGALLGASPGASTAADIMLHLIEKCFPDHVRSPEWQAKLKEMIPSYGRPLHDNPQLINQVRKWNSEALQIKFIEA